jgi:hypothetical protein
MHRLRHPLATLAGLLLAMSCAAHEGHGLPGASHWHASDAFGWALGVGALLALGWLIRRK